MKFTVEAGAFVTKFVKRKMTIHAKNENEAAEKADEKYRDAVLRGDVVDVGSVTIDAIKEC